MAPVKITPSNSKEFLESHKNELVVLVFDAEFTGQQETVESAVKALSESAQIKDKIVLGIVDAEENNDLTTELSVVSVPMIVSIGKSRSIRKIDNLEPSKLIKTVEEELKRNDLMAGGESVDANKADPKEKFTEYLKSLVNRAPVMIFMKGEPSAPRCGFSRQLVELLGKHDIKYETFDILQDDDVRQGLKEYSDWPTYPQIYAKGEFIGGLDILKQMEDSGELEQTLKV